MEGSPSRNALALLFLFGIGAFVTYDLWKGIIEPGPPPAETTQAMARAEPTLATLAAPTLYAEYEANGIAADARYKDKRILVVGLVESIDRDVMGDPYIALSTGRGELASVQCMLAEGQDGRAASMSIGDTAAMEGRVDGKLLNVILRDCRLVNWR